jgi:hypothetical protein
VHRILIQSLRRLGHNGGQERHSLWDMHESGDVDAEETRWVDSVAGETVWDLSGECAVNG